MGQYMIKPNLSHDTQPCVVTLWFNITFPHLPLSDIDKCPIYIVINLGCTKRPVSSFAQSWRTCASLDFGLLTGSPFHNAAMVTLV